MEMQDHNGKSRRNHPQFYGIFQQRFLKELQEGIQEQQQVNQRDAKQVNDLQMKEFKSKLNANQ